MGQRYAFVVAAVAFLILLATAGRCASAPGLMLVPWEKAFGWDRGTISFAAALGIFLYGLIGPFAAAVMQSFGVRRTLAVALALMSLSAFLSLFMTESRQPHHAHLGRAVGHRHRLHRHGAGGDHRQPLVRERPRPRDGPVLRQHRHGNAHLLCRSWRSFSSTARGSGR